MLLSDALPFIFSIWNASDKSDVLQLDVSFNEFEFVVKFTKADFIKEETESKA